ncbi:hypothetical protein [Streptomyces sp. NPDC088730]
MRCVEEPISPYLQWNSICCT